MRQLLLPTIFSLLQEAHLLAPQLGPYPRELPGIIGFLDWIFSDLYYYAPGPHLVCLPRYLRLYFRSAGGARMAGTATVRTAQPAAGRGGLACIAQPTIPHRPADAADPVLSARRHGNTRREGRRPSPRVCHGCRGQPAGSRNLAAASA